MLVWSKQADADLIDIWLHIAEHSPQNADSMLRRLQQRCDALVQFPEMEPLRGGRRADVRQLSEGEYVIFYRIARDRIDILRVLHGRLYLGDW